MPPPSISQIRDQHSYYSDGNIVLSAHDDLKEPKKVVYFRVHMAILSRESPVFRDMFELPTPASLSDQDTYDGVPLIFVYDAVDHLRGFLLAIYELFAQDSTPELLTGALILARKYQADTLQTKIVSRIKADWPEDYDEWKLKWFGSSPIMEMRPFVLGPYEPERLVRLARATQLQGELRGPLAMAYYSMSCRRHCRALERRSADLPDTLGDLVILANGYREMTVWFMDNINLGDAGHRQRRVCFDCWRYIFDNDCLKGLLASSARSTNLLEYCEKSATELECGGSGGDDGFCDTCRRLAVQWLREVASALFSRLSDFFRPEEAGQKVPMRSSTRVPPSRSEPERTREVFKILYERRRSYGA